MPGLGYGGHGQHFVDYGHYEEFEDLGVGPAEYDARCGVVHDSSRLPEPSFRRPNLFREMVEGAGQ